MKKLLLLKGEIEEEFGLPRAEIDLAVEKGLLTPYAGPEANKWEKFHRADVIALAKELDERLLSRQEVEDTYGITRHHLVKAVKEGRLQKYEGPLEKRYWQFRARDVEAFLDAGGETA